MYIYNDVVEAIGNTPLIKLKRASEMTGCTILGKAEFMNPGQSVKDRPGKQMILEAEKRGDLKPGGLVVEGTAGNTGIGLAVVASARGYRTIIVMPDTQSQEKKDTLRLCGAELVEVPALPYAIRITISTSQGGWPISLRKSEPNGVLFADQWNNLDNPKAHYVSTGAGNLAADRWQSRRLHLLGRHRRHAGRHQRLPARKEKGHRDRAGRPAGCGDVRILQARRAEIVAGRLDHRRHRPGPHHRQSSRTPRSTRPIRFRTRKPFRSSSICSSTKGCASAAPPASMSPARSASPARWGPATPS